MRMLDIMVRKARAARISAGAALAGVKNQVTLIEIIGKKCSI